MYDNIGDQGSQALAQSLRTNTSLKYLYLGRNNIVDQGVQALVQALQTNSTLKDLKLEYNKSDSNNIFRRILESIKINEFPHKFEQNYAKKIQRQGIYHDLVV